MKLKFKIQRQPPNSSRNTIIYVRYLIKTEFREKNCLGFSIILRNE